MYLFMIECFQIRGYAAMRQNAKYKQIESYILGKINSGELSPGDQIETEKQLCEKFGIGHITINKALNNLATKGYITRTPGKGSFVSHQMMVKTIRRNPISFTKDMASLGMVAGSKLVEYKILHASAVPDIQKYLELEDNDLIHYFERIRTADGTPIAISYTYISAKIIPAIDISYLEGGSFQAYLDSINFPERTGAVYMMSAHLPTAEQKRLLGVDSVALLRNSHITYIGDEIPFEYIQTYYLCDRYEYMFSTVENKSDIFKDAVR